MMNIKAKKFRCDNVKCNKVGVVDEDAQIEMPISWYQGTAQSSYGGAGTWHACSAGHIAGAVQNAVGDVRDERGDDW